ncbi:MAG: wax ester/triacylglycerol synthase family O-acyltransferase [Actinobacteria bacterium]|nr:wax ester/triacylglycerol synthase family O-acyltransferase [Actinomycetota bacterium]
MAAFSSRLNASDAVLWNIERDPALRTTIVAISLLDRAPDWPRLRGRVEAAAIEVPRLRQRVVPAPLHADVPRWRDDASFDLDYHLRRIECPSPATIDGVLELAAPIAMAAFDKSRPLWEFTVVEGLEGGRAAFIQKVHHSVTDGVGAVRLARCLLDDRRSPRGPHQPMEFRTEQGEGDLERVRRLAGVAAGAWLRPAEAVGATLRTARSAVKLVAPARAPMSPLMVGRGPGRRLFVLDISLAAVRDSAHRAGATLNDAFLAGVVEGLRRYHERHGSTLEALRINMPVNLRRPDDPPGANRFVPVRMVVPIEVDDAPERMRRIDGISRAWRDEPALPVTDLISGVLTRLHPVVSTSFMAGMLKCVDVVATNVPGFDRAAYLGGAEVLRQFAFAPPSGAALSIALLSYVDRCCIGVNVDTTAVPDGDRLADCLRDGFDDVVHVRGQHGAVSR